MLSNRDSTHDQSRQSNNYYKRMKPLKLTMILFSCTTGWRVTWPQHCACACELQENPAEIRLTFSQQKCLHNYRAILSGY